MKLKLIVWGLGITTVTSAGLVGLISLVNLPYPMIRRPVSKVAPLLLLPSYIEMDHHYRKAIAHVEQADQLIHHISSFDDIKLGEEKVKLAQENLDKLPVWFIGYEPKRYCQMFSCSWQFTIDEFEAARKTIGRMEAIIFQQKNAFNTYQKAETNLQQAKENYQQATQLKEKQTIVTSWQQSLDELQQLPPQTFAATLVSSKLESYQRDFQAVTGSMTENQQTDTMITVAKNFSLSATKLCKNPPHSVNKWEECQQLWQKAISRLETISQDDIGYLETQALLAEYETNSSIVKLRSKVEKESVEALDVAKKEIQNLQEQFANGVEKKQRQLFISKMQGNIEKLKQVETGTTVYNEAQELLSLAQAKIKEATK
ncbi:hypothetical protein [Crocosphaera chwakensis]|uniref:Uncharacterized protein n=1 Tax=Crocosphaera chwakensis CCY0110 TaxID=391612 RepID=A3IK43_9CHRO|nr:hypothetical protein [Crocosphaera chwakensis]EAZ93032.1 hypothetical protein CY0110_03149 [Crocosphaera chwakensis CCY0110]